MAKILVGVPGPFMHDYMATVASVDQSVARQYGVVTDRYKLVYFYEPAMNYWELFDLKTDPLELKSVYDDPAYSGIRGELHGKLDRLRVDLKVPATDPPESELKAR